MYAVLDIGGTNTRIGVSENLESFKNVVKFSTPKNLQDLKQKINAELKNYELSAICVGVAGFIDRANKSIIKAPHIPYLDNKNINEILTYYENVYLENDAALAGLAEAIKGQGKSYNRVAYITISTGVGGTLIRNGRLPETNFNFEPGHHIIAKDEQTAMSTIIPGSWEAFSSGTAFKHIYNVDPEEHNTPEIWSDYAKNLAVGLLNLSLLWSPDAIVLGGSMSKKANLFLKEVNEFLNRNLPFPKPDIKISQIGDHNGLMGGLELLRATPL